VTMSDIVTSGLLRTLGGTLILGTMASPRVVFVTAPDAQILDVAGPLEVFTSANHLIDDACYRTEVVSSAGGRITTSCHLQIITNPISAVRSPIDTMFVAGGIGVAQAMQDPHLIHHVRRLANGATRVASVCTGAFILAASGLLDGRRATTHWEWCAPMAAMFPDIELVPDAIYVRDGDIWTSAGVTAGIDLALSFVAADHGQQAAALVARHLVVYLQRSGGQAQFSLPLAAQTAEREPLRQLLAWAIDNPASDLTVATLARRMNLSERQFARVFKSELGISPAAHIETMRLECACRLLETTTLAVDQIASTSGFSNTETMHRAFRRRLNTTPGQHRRHFSS
jgi:transcriptional regulator GlxA family with amidase domain